MKTLTYTFVALLTVGTALSAHSQSQEKPATAQVAASTANMTDGEVRKIDKEAKKITIKHGEIKNLDMPGMTMVFQVREEALLSKVKAGDKVRFIAEKIDGAIVVTDIQPVM
jgi:Cu/Ag efflux protein CusF